MSLAVDVIKRGGARRTESFSRNKLYKSIIATCRSHRIPEGHSEDIAKKVCDSVEVWASSKHEVTSYDIRVAATIEFRDHHPEAAYLYEQQSIII